MCSANGSNSSDETSPWAALFKKNRIKTCLGLHRLPLSLKLSASELKFRINRQNFSLQHRANLKDIFENGLFGFHQPLGHFLASQLLDMHQLKQSQVSGFTRSCTRFVARSRILSRALASKMTSKFLHASVDAKSLRNRREITSAFRPIVAKHNLAVI